MSPGLSFFTRFGLSRAFGGAIPCNAVYYAGSPVYFDGEIVTFGTLTADTTGVSADSTCGTADFAVVSPFAPNDIAGLRLWLDADDASTITEVAGAVSEWRDKSGNSNHATQATGSMQPTTGTRTVNGKNALDFVADRMGSPYALTAASTIFAVFSADAYSTSSTLANRIFGTYSGTGALDAGTTLLDSYNGTLRILNDGSTTATVPSPPTGPKLVRIERSAAGVRVFADTVSILESGAASTTAAARTLWLGEDSNTVNNEWFDGLFCEVLAYDSILSAGDAASVESYLMGRWGIAFAIGNLPGVRLWLDAGDASTITESGGAVSTWTSKDPNARVFSQATGSLQPATGAATLNGLNVLGFVGDYLVSTAASSVWTFLHDGKAHFFFAVVKFGNAADPNAFLQLLGTSPFSGSSRGFSVAYDDRASVPFNNRIRAYVGSGGGAPVDNASLDGAIVPNAHALVRFETDADASPASARSAIFVNGGAEIANNSSGAAVSGVSPTGTLHIASAPAGASPLTGEIAEIILFEAVPTDGWVGSVQAYLADKWGITL